MTVWSWGRPGVRELCPFAPRFAWRVFFRAHLQSGVPPGPRTGLCNVLMLQLFPTSLPSPPVTLTWTGEKEAEMEIGARPQSWIYWTRPLGIPSWSLHTREELRVGKGAKVGFLSAVDGLPQF